MNKRLLSILMVLCLLVSLVPSAVSATEAKTTSSGYTAFDGPGLPGESDEGYDKLVDGDINTKWCVNHKVHTDLSVKFEVPSAMKVSGYSITTGDDNKENPGRNPESWELWGSNDYNSQGQSTWHLIDKVTNDTVLQDENLQTYDFVVSEEQATKYKYFNFKVNGIENSDILQISELVLWSCEHNFEAGDVYETTKDELGYTVYTCNKCGYVEKRPDLSSALKLTLEDAGSNGWSGAQLQIYRDSQSWKNITLESGSYEVVYLPCYKDSVYSFYWKKGGHDAEITLTIEGCGQFYCDGAFWNHKDGDLLLRLNTGDYTEVEKAIKAIPSDLSMYTEESVKFLRDTVDSVNWELPPSKQKEIDEMATEVLDAINALLPYTQSRIDMTTAESDLYITKTGYRWGEDGEEVAYTEPYRLSGTSKTYRIIVESGSHEISFYELHLANEYDDGKSPFSIQKGASVKLTLIGQNELKCLGRNFEDAGLNVPAGAKLEITEQSTGSLYARGRYRSAGIGGNEKETTGTIIINGGRIETKSQSGAGIGSGDEGTGECAITINGGVLTINSNDGAGIGAGRDSSGTCEIIINGGDIKITSDGGACIGNGHGSFANCNITIKGGNIESNVKRYAAGIGNGADSVGKSSIKIRGGTITANAKYAAGIGVGDNATGDSDIIISGGIVKTSSSSKYGAGIGIGIQSKGKSTFSTGTNGNAVIFASSINDSSKESDWRGIIFNGSDAGTVYGTCITIPASFSLESGKSLTVGESQSLVIPEGVTLTNEGTITNNGKICVDGKLKGVADNVYYPLTLTNATAEENTAIVNDKTYGKAGAEIALTAKEAEKYYAFDKWAVTGVSVEDENSMSISFTMPENAVSAKATYKYVHVHDFETVTTKATTSKNGTATTKCSVCGHVKSTTTISYPKTIKLSTTSYTYNGKVKKPTVKVLDSNGKTIPSSNYTVSYASGRKNVGKYKVTVTFKKSSEKYTGSKYTYFRINPKGTSILDVAGSKKAFTVKWKKQSAKMATSRITGYQIKYSTSSKMTSPKYKTVEGYKYTSKKVSSLKAKKKYYVQVRTYKTVNGTKYYSSWSSMKSVKTK